MTSCGTTTPAWHRNWAAVAQALGDQGVLDGAGQALAAILAETVRKTWWKVCRDKEREQSAAQDQQDRGIA